MSDTKITFDGIYEFYGGLGCWFMSREKVVPGTVRYVRGMLFYAKYWHKPYIAWTPVDESKNTPSGYKAFKENL